MRITSSQFEETEDGEGVTGRGVIVSVSDDGRFRQGFVDNFPTFLKECEKTMEELKPPSFNPSSGVSRTNTTPFVTNVLSSSRLEQLRSTYRIPYF